MSQLKDIWQLKLKVIFHEREKKSQNWTHGFPITGQMFNPLSQQGLTESWGTFLGSNMTDFLHTARFNIVEVSYEVINDVTWWILSLERNDKISDVIIQHIDTLPKYG